MNESLKNPFYGSTRFAGKCAHLGVTGSVAAYKSADLLRSLLKLQIKTSATLTEGAKKFVSSLLFQSLGAQPVYEGLFATNENVFAHLEPAQEADVFIVAPATANFIAKAAHGVADDMLSAQLLAFAGPTVVAPAMNPRMWANKATIANTAILKERKIRLVNPAEGNTACGEAGQGRLADLQEIFLIVLKALAPQDMSGLRVMVTLGPTREMWDGVRFFSNPSSGKMGCALATAAWLRGAEVNAICGQGVDIFLPSEIRRINVIGANDMYNEAHKLWPDMDIGMFCAAVADFSPIRPENANNIKIKKTDYADSFELLMLRNPDILSSIGGKKKPAQKTLGFAAEITPDVKSLAPYASQKLLQKQADIIASNRVNAEVGSFGSEETSMLVVDKNGLEETWGQMTKADIAWELCSWLLRL